MKKEIKKIDIYTEYAGLGVTAGIPVKFGTAHGKTVAERFPGPPLFMVLLIKNLPPLQSFRGLKLNLTLTRLLFLL